MSTPTPTPTQARTARALTVIGVALAASAAWSHAAGASRTTIALLAVSWALLILSCTLTPPGDWTS